MYGCNDCLSCLSGSVTRIGLDLSGNISRIGDKLSGVVSSKGISLIGRVSLVCSAGNNEYLRVNPDIVWLTQYTHNGEFDIYSNVSWKIV